MNDEFDSYSETEDISWFGRIKNAIGGILFGLILIIVSGGLLFWNEGRSVKRHKALSEGAASVQNVDAREILPENDSKLIYTNGFATTETMIKDPGLPVEAKALRYKRTVSMYQWDESKETKTKKKLGGGKKKVTTYTYRKVWSERLINSNSFKKSQGHENPSAMRFNGITINARDAYLGKFLLTPLLLNKLTSFQNLSVKAEAPSNTNLKPYMGGYYLGSNPDSPSIGDTKITFSEILPGNISVIGSQTGNNISVYTTKSGGEILELEEGIVDAATMFKRAEKRNTLMAWGLRAVGLILMVLGFFLLFKPIAVFADLIPFFGGIVEVGIGFIAFILGLTGTLGVIAVGWLFYRPVLGGILIFIAVLLLSMLAKKTISKKRKPQISEQKINISTEKSGKPEKKISDDEDPFLT